MDHRGYLIGPWVDWFSLRSQIETAVPRSNPYEDAGDILYIFDACSVGVAGIYYDGPEVLAACGWDTIAGSSLAKSFTQTLTTKLREFGGMPRTVAQVFTEIFREADENEIPAMPVHIPHLKKPSTTISQLPLPQGPKPEPFSKRFKTFVDSPIPQHRVLIGVNLKDRLPDLQEWTKYLTTNIHLGFFLRMSTSNWHSKVRPLSF